MARKITDYDGTITPISGTDPYGNIKNAPSGTHINAKSNADLQVFFQRLMANNGITPNSLPEDAVNGFQMMQALNSAFGQPMSALARVFGSDTGVFIGRITDGMDSTVVLGTTTVHPGFFVYNGFYYFFTGGTYSAIAPGNAMYVVLGTTDGLPTATLAQMINTTPDNASQFQLAHITTIASLSAPSVLALNTFTAYNTGYSDGSILPAYCKDGMSVVRLIGIINATYAGFTDVINITGLPVGFRPAHDKVFPCVYCNFSTGLNTVIGVRVSTLGIISVEDGSTVLGAAGSYLMIDTIQYPTYY